MAVRWCASLLGSLLIILGGCVSLHAASKPNLIFIITDDQDALLGSLDVMPEYVKYMREGGMEFTNAFVASPKCCPSRTSLLSGRFSHNLNDQALGWCGNFLTSHVNTTFIAHIKDQGYSTGFFGKMVNNMGEMCKKNNPFVPLGFNVSSGDRFVAMCNEVTYYENTFNIDQQLYTTGTSPSEYLTSFIGNHTISWLGPAARAAAAGGAPFFAYIAPHAPHFPAEPAVWYLDAPLPSTIAPKIPSYNTSVKGKSWAIRENAPLSAFTADGIDAHYRNRLRTLMSVDDLVAAVFAVLQETGTLNNTYVICTSDHGYHLGSFRVPFEKSLPYDTDIRVPFFVRGPGISGGRQEARPVSLMDVGATFMELAGASPPASRPTDGTSLVPLLGATPPAAWRDTVLIEFFGFPNQWMDVCGWVYNVTGCPAPLAVDPDYLIDGPQNTYAMLRTLNSTTNFAYVEFRPMSAAPAPGATNWTEAYNLQSDPWQQTNIAAALPPAQRRAWSSSLWSVATCRGAECP